MLLHAGGVPSAAHMAVVAGYALAQQAFGPAAARKAQHGHLANAYAAWVEGYGLWYVLSINCLRVISDVRYGDLSGFAICFERKRAVSRSDGAAAAAGIHMHPANGLLRRGINHLAA